MPADLYQLNSSPFIASFALSQWRFTQGSPSPIRTSASPMGRSIAARIRASSSAVNIESFRSARVFLAVNDGTSASRLLATFEPASFRAFPSVTRSA